MNLESLPKFYSPKSPKLNDETPATSSDALTITDVMAAQGMVQSKAPLGFALFLAKVGDRRRADRHRWTAAICIVLEKSGADKAQ